MALIDTAFDTWQSALGDATDLAGDSFDSVSATLGELAADERSRKKLVVLLIIFVLALLGFLAWKKSSSAAEPESETA
jgi:hypothetical protein